MAGHNSTPFLCFPFLFSSHRPFCFVQLNQLHAAGKVLQSSRSVSNQIKGNFSAELQLATFLMGVSHGQIAALYFRTIQRKLTSVNSLNLFFCTFINNWICTICCFYFYSFDNQLMNLLVTISFLFLFCTTRTLRKRLINIKTINMCQRAI